MLVLVALYMIPIGILSWLGVLFVVNQYDKGTKFGLWCHKLFK